MAKNSAVSTECQEGGSGYNMECLHPKYLSKQDITVPCGHCAFCMATRRSDWALRIHYEQRQHLDAKFLTLTYANPHLKWKNGKSQLHKKDLQNYMKRLRKAITPKRKKGQPKPKTPTLRYYAVGEYGSRTYRPHYHVLMFGTIPENVIRTSWIFGQVHIGSVRQQSIMYCLGYMVNGKHWTMTHGRERPFCLMSRRPGLGNGYLSTAMIEWHKSGRKNYALLDGVKRHLPRYYKEKIFSKIDRVRIAVRDQKEHFKKEVEWIRSPAMAKMKDPLKYRKEQRRRLAQKIKDKTKQNVSL